MEEAELPTRINCIFCKGFISFTGLPALRYKDHLCKLYIIYKFKWRILYYQLSLFYLSQGAQPLIRSWSGRGFESANPVPGADSGFILRTVERLWSPKQFWRSLTRNNRHWFPYWKTRSMEILNREPNIPRILGSRNQMNSMLMITPKFPKFVS